MANMVTQWGWDTKCYGSWP